MTDTQKDTADTDVAPDDGGAVATLDWVLDHVDRTAFPVDASNESAVLAVTWALGFAGATREQVWWVMRDARLRTAFVSICNTMARVRPTQLPGWLANVVALPPAERTVLARTTEEMLDEGSTRIPADRGVLFDVFSGHPDATVSPDRRYVVVTRESLAELTEVARSVTAADIERLLERAREPFGRRLAEAAAVAMAEGTAFHSRRARRTPAGSDASAGIASVRTLSSGG